MLESCFCSVSFAIEKATLSGMLESVKNYFSLKGYCMLKGFRVRRLVLYVVKVWKDRGLRREAVPPYREPKKVVVIPPSIH
jgi:hypothetical protein